MFDHERVTAAIEAAAERKAKMSDHERALCEEMAERGIHRMVCGIHECWTDDHNQDHKRLVSLPEMGAEGCVCPADVRILGPEHFLAERSHRGT